ncbi:MAG: ABC transporter substrate-binding protein [Sulfurospirillaceae bacterium]|nr:ABC transporter substrate-binding protein [Sulfurospirillaceae bacterium]
MRWFIIFFMASALTYSQADILEDIQKTHQLRVCVWPEYYGISYIDPRMQTLEGIDVDLAKELAKTLQANLSFIESSFATLISDVENHRCDIAMFAIGKTKQRQEHLYLTSPHLSSDIYAIVSKYNNRIQQWNDIDKPDIIVAVAKGTYHVDVMKNHLKYAKLLIVDSLHAREQEVEAGRADVFMTDFPFGIHMVSEHPWAKLITPTEPFHMTPYGWAIAKNEKKFADRVESFIKEIKADGRLFKAAKRHQLESIIVTKP